MKAAAPIQSTVPPRRTDSPTLAHGTIQVWRGSLDQESEIQRRLAALLSDDESERARRFRFDRDRARYVVGRGLLRLMLGRYVDADAAALRFGYGPQGKPSLHGGGPQFNLAHSGATALYAFSSDSQLGVDVELMQPDFTDDRIAERFFSPLEVETLRALRQEDRAQAFLTCWTRKEAFLKARGDGLTLALDSFDVTLAPGEPPALLRTGWSPRERFCWKLVDLSDLEQGQVAALAAPATNWEHVCHDIDIDTMVFN
jgi:4'-phosphopantetheinyl transferase